MDKEGNIVVNLKKARESAFAGLGHSLRGGSLFLFGGLMLSNVVAYLYQMIMARVMDPGDYGVLVTLTSITYVLTVLMRTVQAWVIRAISEQREAAASFVRPVFTLVIRTLLVMGTLAFFAHWLFSGWVANFLQMSSGTPVIVLGLFTFSSFLVPVPRGVLLALNRPYLASFIHILEPVARLIGGLALVMWGLEVNGAIAGYAIGNLLAFGIALIPLWPLLRHHAGYDETAAAKMEKLGGLDKYAMWMLIVNISLMFISSIDQIAVKHFFSEEVAGNYAVAFLLGRIIVMSTTALGWVIFTRSAILPSDHPQRGRVLIKGLLLIGAISISLTSLYLLAPGLAVKLMGGSQYDTAHNYVGLIGIEMTLFALVYIQAYYQISLRNTRVALPLFLAALVEVALLALYHSSVQEILQNLILVMAGLLVWVSCLSWLMVRGVNIHIDLSQPRPIMLRASGGSAPDVNREGAS